ncbi:patatin-like phospholipase family protein [Burkholderia cenocepacia]|uniref:patatin-like phospholipase family protein n=1 Tax=Burkholderia cenocepacia TaxID=95486 RepID=UPI0022EA2D51|nr:patatin-like phospholipase family protein [Burkholderia cenocepacia]MDA3669890.1 patatin-like phospholipase family protein [Burkholderia cenocepacia]MDA3679857.1 patatin-like phospholipase family protein [Burkholderia cenocepacia]MDA3687692.1 patatin-like phospholipase family protein [Burkholderia cenocepacia]MDA3694904.1 patatin-like phospholipase family protein [Burkholderia cenocepacia]MDA3702040.1 patatin-like phospholipase family protein [Burkholderia cenocepacia]
MTNEEDHAVQEPAPAESTGAPRPVFLAFQGGGARGISHVGGLAAINHLGLKVEGVAGTSAGAIMAALVAAHYRAEQLLDPTKATHLLQGRYKRATELFGKTGWNAIWRLRTGLKAAVCIAGVLVRCGIPRALRRLWQRTSGKAALIGTGVMLAVGLDYFVPRSALFGLLVVVGGLTWALFSCLSGLASLDAVRALVDDAIAEGLNIEDRGITFEKLQAHGGLPLKLVATNISTQSLELFSVETTPTAKVADAVAASICLPIAFKPWSFSFLRKGDLSTVERCFIDGGIVSNLPVWTFDEERALQPEAVTVAFGLEPEKSSNGPPHWLLAALHTVVAGPPEVHFRGVERLIHIPLPSTISVLDFDASFATLAREVENAKEVAKAHLERNLTEVPEAIRQTLIDMQTNICRELRDRLPEEFAKDEMAAPLVRIALAIQKPSEHITLSIAYEVGHTESKRGSRFSLKSSPVGRPWVEDRTGFYIFGAASDQARIYGDSAWTGFFPIDEDPQEQEGARSELAVVAIIDSAMPLPDTIVKDETRLEDFWLTLSDAAFGFFDENEVGRLFRRSIAWL